jgi:hypothetical protein
MGLLSAPPGPPHEKASYGGLASHRLRDASTLPQPSSLHFIKAEDPVGATTASRCLSNAGVREDAPREAWQHGLGDAARHIPGPFVEEGGVLHYLAGAMVLLQDGPQLGRR